MRLNPRLKKLEAGRKTVTTILFRRVFYEHKDGTSELNSMWANLIGPDLTLFLEPGETEDAFRARVQEKAAELG